MTNPPCTAHHTNHLKPSKVLPRWNTHLVTIVDGSGDLSEDSASIRFSKSLPVADVVVELAPGGDLHHQHHLLLVLEHCDQDVDAENEVCTRAHLRRCG